MNWSQGFYYINPWRNNRLETYILQTCISMFASALMIISSIIFLIDYIGISKTFSTQPDMNGLKIIGLILQKSPSAILILLPFAFLFGSLFAFVSLNRRSELIAMRAAGVSAWRFVMPAAISAFAFGLLTITLFNPGASLLQAGYEKQAAVLNGAAPVTAPGTAIYLRQGDGKNQTVIRADSQLGMGRLRGLTFWIYDIDNKQVPHFSKRIDAEEATLQPGQWRLKNATEAQPGEPTRRYDILSIPSTLDPQAAFRKFASTQSVPFWELPGLIHRNQVSGSPTVMYRLKLHQLLSTPLMFAAMSALGAVFSLRLMRLGGLTKLVISGISLGFVIFFVNQLFSSMGKAAVIPVALAGWSPAILAALMAMTLLVYTEDG